MSSSGHMVARVLRAMMAARSVVRTPDLMEIAELSAPTIRKYMDLLRERGVSFPREEEQVAVRGGTEQGSREYGLRIIATSTSLAARRAHRCRGSNGKIY
jgi:hypothetical protein